MEECINSRQTYHYQAFGLHIESEIMLPELTIGQCGNADVTIQYGEVPQHVQKQLEGDQYFESGNDEFLLRIDNIASYYVANGTNIVVQQYEQESFHIGRLYLLGTVMGILLLQRGIVPMHASTVIINGQGVMFSGVSGAGKSTMAAALGSRGYTLLADDVSAVTCDANGVFMVQPGYPLQKLCQSSADMIGITTDGCRLISEERNKYVVPVAEGFSSKPVPIVAMYEIGFGECADISIQPIKGVSKMTTIMANTYRAEFISGLGLQIAHFKQCAKLIKQVQIFRLTRPEGVPSLDRQVAVMLEHFFANKVSSPQE